MLARLGNVILWTTCLFASSMTASGHDRRFFDACGTSASPPRPDVKANILDRPLRAND